MLACSLHVNGGQFVICYLFRYRTQKANICVDFYIILSHNVLLYQYLALPSSLKEWHYTSINLSNLQVSSPVTGRFFACLPSESRRP